MIRKPIFVKINAGIWVELWRAESAFEMQERIQAAVEQFLEPAAPGARSG